MTVREATAADISAILELLRQSHARSIHREVPFDNAHSAAMVAHQIASPGGLVAVTDDVSAVLIVVLAPLHFNGAVFEAFELAFWGAGGGDLLDYAMEWAKAKGARRIEVNNECTQQHAAMSRWYRRKGLNPSGVSYGKVL